MKVQGLYKVYVYSIYIYIHKDGKECFDTSGPGSRGVAHGTSICTINGDPRLANLDSTTAWFVRNLADLGMHTWRFAGPGLALLISIRHVVAASGCSSVYRPPRNNAVRRLGAICGPLG